MALLHRCKSSEITTFPKSTKVLLGSLKESMKYNWDIERKVDSRKEGQSTSIWKVRPHISNLHLICFESRSCIDGVNDGSKSTEDSLSRHSCWNWSRQFWMGKKLIQENGLHQKERNNSKIGTARWLAQEILTSLSSSDCGKCWSQSYSWFIDPYFRLNTFEICSGINHNLSQTKLQASINQRVGW